MSLDAKQLRALMHYDPETGLFTRLVRSNRNTQIGETAGTTKSQYVVISIKGRLYPAHRLAWLYVHSAWPSCDIDHIDGDKRNNRLKNLRDVTKSVNMQNRKRAQANNQSKLAGAMKNNGSWMARIRVAGTNKYLGNFPTPELAHNAYLKAKRVFHEGCTI